jgi:hypothetical protein
VSRASYLFTSESVSTGCGAAFHGRSEIDGPSGNIWMAIFSRRNLRKFENPFLQALKSGLTMKPATITRVPDADDDLLEIHFGAPDPAIKQFTVSS